MDSEVIDDMVEQAREAAQNGTNGKLDLGAAVRTHSGNVYTGTVVETQDRSQSIHAERLAVFKAISAGDDYIDTVVLFMDNKVIPGDPEPVLCGGCLHVLYEFSGGEDVTVIAASSDGEREQYSLEDLYPKPWYPGFNFDHHRPTVDERFP